MNDGKTADGYELKAGQVFWSVTYSIVDDDYDLTPIDLKISQHTLKSIENGTKAIYELEDNGYRGCRLNCSYAKLENAIIKYRVLARRSNVC